MIKSNDYKWYVSSAYSEKIEFRPTKKGALKEADKMLRNYDSVTVDRWH